MRLHGRSEIVVKKISIFLFEEGSHGARVLPFDVPCPALSPCFLFDLIYSKKSRNQWKILRDISAKGKNLKLFL